MTDMETYLFTVCSNSWLVTKRNKNLQPSDRPTVCNNAVIAARQLFDLVAANVDAAKMVFEVSSAAENWTRSRHIDQWGGVFCDRHERFLKPGNHLAGFVCLSCLAQDDDLPERLLDLAQCMDHAMQGEVAKCSLSE